MPQQRERAIGTSMHLTQVPCSRPLPLRRLQVPCSWGALFLGSMWRDFVEFYQMRARPPFFDFSQEARQKGLGKFREKLGDLVRAAAPLHLLEGLSVSFALLPPQRRAYPRLTPASAFVIATACVLAPRTARTVLTRVVAVDGRAQALSLPNARSNVWPRSWKRFMIDFMYGRGYLMIYPNLREQRAFSTTYMERGDHTGKDGKKENLESSKLRTDIDKTKTTSLIGEPDKDELVSIFATLPPIHEAPLFDLHHWRRASRDMLVWEGFAFTENVRWWGQHYARRDGHRSKEQLYAALADKWSGIPPPADGAGGCVLDHEPRGVGPALAQSHIAAQGGGAPHPGASQRFLIYQPPAGIGEWFISLRNALGIGHALNRTVVVPHILWGGSMATRLNFSALYDMAPLLRLVPPTIEMEQFLALGALPTRLAMLQAKDPRVMPARLYFERIFEMTNMTSVQLPTQMAAADDYRRLYGGCGDQVLALSQTYATFDGFDHQSREHAWLGTKVYPALWADQPRVRTLVAMLIKRLTEESPSFTCMHLTDLDTALMMSRSVRCAGVRIFCPMRTTRASSAMPVGSRLCQGLHSSHHRGRHHATALGPRRAKHARARGTVVLDDEYCSCVRSWSVAPSLVPAGSAGRGFCDRFRKRHAGQHRRGRARVAISVLHRRRFYMRGI